MCWILVYTRNVSIDELLTPCEIDLAIGDDKSMSK
jgi:hypothetical protein